jgi:hypothetical protein
MATGVEEARRDHALDVAKEILDMDSLNEELTGELGQQPKFINLSVLYTELTSLEQSDRQSDHDVFSKAMDTFEDILTDCLTTHIYEQDIIPDGFSGTVVKMENPLTIDNGIIQLKIDQDVLIGEKPKLGQKVKITTNTERIGLGDIEVLD